MSKLAAVFLLLIAMPAIGQDAKNDDEMKNCPMHKEDMAWSHDAVVKSRGDQAMGFPHDKTTHHFRMTPDGGTIEVTVNDPNDKENVSAIRANLGHISAMFGEGDFSVSTFIHGRVPPGVTTMKLMKSAIHYSYEDMPSGGRVRIQSSEAVAVAAIHDFLRFQITEHQTGDSLEPAANRPR